MNSRDNRHAQISSMYKNLREPCLSKIPMEGVLSSRHTASSNFYSRDNSHSASKRSPHQQIPQKSSLVPVRMQKSASTSIGIGIGDPRKSQLYPKYTLAKQAILN